MNHCYALALGSNIYGKVPPDRTVVRAFNVLEAEAGALLARSRILANRPVGPGRRDFANAVAILETGFAPADLLALAKNIEHRFGRRRNRRWGERILDIDIILWSGGMWADNALTIPHPRFRDRPFVLAPLAEVAADWRDPVTRLTVSQLHHRLTAHSPVDRAVARP